MIAPPGFGKTVTLLGYLSHSQTNGIYCPLLPGADAQSVWAAIAEAIDAPGAGTSHAEIVRALSKRAPLELALDCEGLPNADGVAAMLRLIDDVSEDVALLIASRSRVAFRVGSLVSRGLAALCDVEQLAFTRDTIRHLAETCHVRFFYTDVVRLLEMTDGWPLVVSCAIRKAAEDGRSLFEAFENWRTRRAHFFSEFIDATAAQSPEREANLVRQLRAGKLLDQDELEHLEGQGLFVIHTPHGYRPLNVLARGRLSDRSGLSPQPPSPLQVRFFGWFAAEIDGRPIEWIRRRDRQIFKYIALQPSGRVTRAELAEVFWPGAEKHLVAQGVRTACSNIRKAIGHVAGFDRVGAYFRANDELSIDFDNVVVDVHRYSAHVDDGDEQYERGDRQAAYTHYRNAGQLYGNLLIADAREPWVASQAAIFERSQNRVLARLAEFEPGPALAVES